VDFSDQSLSVCAIALLRPGFIHPEPGAFAAVLNNFTSLLSEAVEQVLFDIFHRLPFSCISKNFSIFATNSQASGRLMSVVSTSFNPRSPIPLPTASIARGPNRLQSGFVTTENPHADFIIRVCAALLMTVGETGFTPFWSPPPVF
jgi:hypothetical protein